MEKVEPIYPSVTYPSHSTIVTGNYPNKHGVVSNTLLQPGRESPDWHWYRKSIQGTTLYDEAHKANLTTAFYGLLPAEQILITIYQKSFQIDRGKIKF